MHQQRVVRFVVVTGREIRLVGRNQRQPLCIGKIDQARLGAPFLVGAVALQFDVETVAEQARETIAARGCQRRLIGAQRQRDRSVGPAGQRDQVFGIVGEPVELDVRRLVDRGFQERPRVQPHQAAITALARRQQDDPCGTRRQHAAHGWVDVAEIHRELAAHDRLDAVPRHLVGEFQRPEHVVGVGQRQRRLAVGLRELAELAILIEPFSSE